MLVNLVKSKVPNPSPNRAQVWWRGQLDPVSSVAWCRLPISASCRMYQWMAPTDARWPLRQEELRIFLDQVVSSFKPVTFFSWTSSIPCINCAREGGTWSSHLINKAKLAQINAQKHTVLPTMRKPPWTETSKSKNLPALLDKYWSYFWKRTITTHTHMFIYIYICPWDQSMQVVSTFTNVGSGNDIGLYDGSVFPTQHS